MKAKTRKIKKEFIYRLVAVLVAGITLAAASFSWFMLNKKVSAEGFQMKCQTTRNMVIADTPINVKNSVSIVYSFPVSEQKKLKEATHDWNIGTHTGLAYLRNTGTVDSKTGVPSDDPEYLEVIYDSGTGESRYYRDYSVCIASMGSALPLAHLYATVSYNIEDVSQTIPDYMKAYSVDFYVGTVTAGNYRGTVNLAGYDYRNNGNVLTRIDFNPSAEPDKNPITIPYQKESSVNCLQVIMRVYFDGGLKRVTGTGVENHTYVYADNLKLNSFPICVSFTGVEPVTQ